MPFDVCGDAVLDEQHELLFTKRVLGECTGRRIEELHLELRELIHRRADSEYDGCESAGMRTWLY